MLVRRIAIAPYPSINCDRVARDIFSALWRMPRVDSDIKLDFKDVLFRPKRSTLKSRSEVSRVAKNGGLHCIHVGIPYHLLSLVVGRWTCTGNSYSVTQRLATMAFPLSPLIWTPWGPLKWQQRSLRYPPPPLQKLKKLKLKYAHSTRTFTSSF